MRASEIRSRFLVYFERNAHTVLQSSSLVPGDDPTLLFTNAGMVPFKKVFLGLEEPTPGRRATTSQKCVRAGGKHNDLEQVGHTARHHTFFEMLGNFSFGDYFKSEAIRFAWEFVTGSQAEGNLGVDPRHLRVSVYRDDVEARALWREITGLPDSRIYGLGEKDNFWQMGDTGPCGPCSEIYVDLAHVAADWAFPKGAAGEWTDLERSEFSEEAFVEGAEEGRFLEIWNLVFMQFDRQQDGTLVPLPKPSVDTGAGLERIAAVLQGVANNFHTDVFAPMIAAIEKTVGLTYAPATTSGGDAAAAFDPASVLVLADHARATAFLLADGVFPSNEGRGYVLRRILRRGVRHAWLLGRREPTLVDVVRSVIDAMSGVYPELAQRSTHILETTRAEEERFLATIEGGMKRFEEIAPLHTTQGSSAVRGTIAGEDAFRLYDTFGFPIDLTELMARERGYTVDIAAFESALGAQRLQSQEERRSKKLGVMVDDLGDVTKWSMEASGSAQVTATSLPATTFVGYEQVEVDTLLVAARPLDDGRVAIVLREVPFYAEAGGQVSDQGEVLGDGWRVDVNEVRKLDGRTVLIGKPSGMVALGGARARVVSDRRLDTERNHTATHLLHAALREQLGDHVHQAGSLVAPDRLRFDFTHNGPIAPSVLRQVEEQVNRGIWAATDLRVEQKGYKEAVAEGAMALFGEKYGDVVRVVKIPGRSTELCGGTHVRNTGQIALFKVVSETGVAAGVRRIEAVTGPKAYEAIGQKERALDVVVEKLKIGVPPLDETAEVVGRRLDAMIAEKKALEKKLHESTKGGGASVRDLIAGASSVEGFRLIASTVPATDAQELQALGDVVREQLRSGVAALGATFADGRSTLLVVSTDDARDRGLRADAVVRELAAAAGGRGGGKAHMAQAGIPDASRMPDVLSRLESTVRSLLGV